VKQSLPLQAYLEVLTGIK